MGIYIPLFLDLDLLKIVPSAAIKSIYIPLFLDLDLEKIKWLIMYRKIYIPLFLDLDKHKLYVPNVTASFTFHYF